MIPLSAVKGTPFELNWIADEGGMLLRTFLAQKAISKRALTDIKFAGGLIQVNGREVNVRHVLAAGDKVRVVFPPEVPSDGIEAEPIDLPILFEDSLLIAVAKPAGMNTIPSREHPSGSLASGLLWVYKEQGLQATVHIVTRLDRDTSGIVLAAKNRYVHHLMSEMQKQKKVFRQYEALAEGTFTEVSGFVEAPIGRRDDSIIERMVREDGQYARTGYRLIHQYTEFAHVAVKPETGRTHQIRVHLAHLGHPLAGDDLYGGSRNRIKRQALHCGLLSFRHPVTEMPIRLTMPMPMDMRNILS
ncbi:RluA family pseudouridine synthase [Domibacillus robiginosus]|uniref:RluA family pseudouridine synthase n=1 Tax=Domibacillus robiginosus TaxID=1071054 RepID=UPI00067CF59F|nr:RluA family pseudouridine synthase [Domibacillus robiginosus]